MKHSELHDNIVAPDAPDPLPEDYAIVSEIAARLIEYMEDRRKAYLATILHDCGEVAQGKHPRRIGQELVGLIREHSEIVGHASTGTLFAKLYVCRDRSRLATHWVLHAMSGDIAAIIEPFSQQAYESGFEKQAAHKEYQVAMDVLNEYYPELAKNLVELREARTYPAPYPTTSSTDGRGVY